MLFFLTIHSSAEPARSDYTFMQTTKKVAV